MATKFTITILPMATPDEIAEIEKQQAEYKRLYKLKKGAERYRKEVGINYLRGQDNPLWKGGITPLHQRIRVSYQYRQWRSDVLTRDNFTCMHCGIHGAELEAHHIKPFSEILEKYEITTWEEALECDELWNINNGITLCKECHQKVHSINHTN